jgi:hypothetical protein
MKEWAVAYLAAVLLCAFVIFCSYIVIWAFP